LIDADAYLLQLSLYIHRNPIEAGLVKHIDQYHWSSYKAYIGKTAPPKLSVNYIKHRRDPFSFKHRRDPFSFLLRYNPTCDRHGSPVSG